jgi:tungstate transport system substrate-binding protein
MKKKISRTVTVFILLFLASCAGGKMPDTSAPVRVAIIGGMTTTPLWSKIQAQFEDATGMTIEVVASGPKPVLVRAMKEGKVDFLTMHSSDQTSSLVADGWARDLRPWTKNDLVIVGPAEDPAGISGLKDGPEAVHKIAETGSNWIDFRSNGPRETAHTLFADAAVPMIGPWVLKDEHTDDKDLLHYAAANNAYLIVGRIPVVFNKMHPDPGIKILVQGDPEMRRPYMLMTANPDRFPEANIKGAERLADFLLSDEIQKFLSSYDGGTGDGIPIFYPIRRVDQPNKLQ